MKWELGLLAIVLIASGCAHAQENPETDTTDPSPETSTDSSENIVYYTDSGFQPQQITVQEGETVKWINNASRAMWVGSDRHPTHTNYAGSTLSKHCENGDQTESAFDQCSSGERFRFTFEKTGEWSYHNHESAGDTGTVIVE